MVKVETIRDDNEKRILRCQEDNRIWYQIWYVFFYEKKGGKVRGVLGKDRTKDLIRAIL